MPVTYTASSTGITARQQVTISEPAGTDVRNSASVRTPLEALADFMQYLMSKAGILDATSTWTAHQIFSGGVNATCDAGYGSAVMGATTRDTTRGVYGVASGASADGVYGVSTSGTGVGVRAESQNGQRGALQLVPQATPAAPVNGDLWLEASALKAQIGGTIREIALTSLAKTWSAVQTFASGLSTNASYAPPATHDIVCARDDAHGYIYFANPAYSRHFGFDGSRYVANGEVKASTPTQADSLTTKDYVDTHVNGLFVAAVHVDSSGAIDNSTGATMSSSKIGIGLYQLNLAGLSGASIVCATLTANGSQVEAQTAGGYVTVYTRNGAGNQADAPFSLFVFKL